MNFVGKAIRRTAAPVGLAFDIDGTLLRSDHVLSKAVSDSVRAVAKCGVPVVLVSARPPRSVLSIAAQLGLSGPMVTLNGSVVVEADGVELMERTLSPAVISDVLNLVEASDGVTANLYDGFEWFVTEYDERVEEESAILGFGPTVIANKEEVPAGINKVLVMGQPALLEPLEAEISERGWPVTINRSKSTYLEITDADVTKPIGLRRAAAAYGLETENFTAFGDGDNDIPLFRACGFGVAMGNATEALKAEADIIIGTNDQDAVAAYVYHYLLN